MYQISIPRLSNIYWDPKILIPQYYPRFTKIPRCWSPNIRPEYRRFTKIPRYGSHISNSEVSKTHNLIFQSSQTLVTNIFKHFKIWDSQICINNSFKVLAFLVFFDLLLHKIRAPKSNSWSNSESAQTCINYQKNN